MKNRVLKFISGGEQSRQIATIRHGRAKRTAAYRKAGNARQRASLVEIGNPPMQQQTFATAPLLEMAGVDQFKVKWPTQGDLIAIDAALEGSGGDSAARFWSVLLAHLAGLSLPIAQRLALADMPAVAAMFAHAFRQMRAQLPEGDPRRAEKIPALLAGEVI